jgi:hypothetical protein
VILVRIIYRTYIYIIFQIDNYINMTDVFAVDIGPVVYLIPNEGKLQQVFPLEHLIMYS